MGTDRYMNVYCDWGAHGLWDRRGRAMHPEHLPIPDEFKAGILAWQERFEEIPLEEIVRGVEHPEHWLEGEAIVAALRVLLPGWTVDFDADLEPSS